MTQGEKYTLIFTAILGFLGAFIGSIVSPVLTANYEENIWLRQSVMVQKSKIFEKRVGIIERASKVLNSKSKAKDYRETLKFYAKQAEESSTCFKQVEEYSNFSNCSDIFKIKDASETLQAMSDLDSEYAATIQLAAIYFGEKTKAVCDSLASNPKWWLEDEKLTRRLLAAMNEELQTYNIEYVTDVAIVR